MARRRPSPVRRALAIGLGSVLAGLLVFGTAVVLSRDEDVDVRLGDDEYRVGRVAVLAPQAEVAPVGNNDLRNGDLPIWLVHEGDDPEGGWRALAATAPGAEEGCAVQWEPAAGEFVDDCTGDAYPPDGEGLTRFAVRVEDGDLIVNLRESSAP